MKIRLHVDSPKPLRVCVFFSGFVENFSVEMNFNLYCTFFQETYAFYDDVCCLELELISSEEFAIRIMMFSIHETFCNSTY